VLKKLVCDTSDLALYVNQYSSEKVQAGSVMNSSQTDKNISVLAIVGWTLFIIALFLKFSYYFEARKHKKAYQELANSVNSEQLKTNNH